MPERLRGAHRLSTMALSALMTLVGIALVVVTLTNGGGALARGVIFGVLFALAGAGRLYLTWRRL
jgi:multisubunit Na+/H+ antiporter MnhB subunit